MVIIPITPTVLLHYKMKKHFWCSIPPLYYDINWTLSGYYFGNWVVILRTLLCFCFCVVALLYLPISLCYCANYAFTLTKKNCLSLSYYYFIIKLLLTFSILFYLLLFFCVSYRFSEWESCLKTSSPLSESENKEVTWFYHILFLLLSTGFDVQVYGQL